MTVRAMLICPTTQRAVPAGFVFASLAQFDRTTIVNSRVRCIACGQLHLLDNETVRVFPEEAR